MGQRHQLFVIAKVGNHYRSLAAVHHQWLYGISALRQCLILLRVFSTEANRPMLQQELAMAERFFRKKGPPPMGPSRQKRPEKEKPIPFPFIHTCLILGAGYNISDGAVSSVLDEPFGMGYNQGDNNDGITVLDITDLNEVKYCFVNFVEPIYYPTEDSDEEDVNRVDMLHRPLTGRQYLESYYEPSELLYGKNIMTLNTLDTKPVIDVRALAATWPWGPWRLGDISDLSITTDNSPLPKGPKGLVEQSFDKLIKTILSSVAFDFRIIDNSIQSIPQFKQNLMYCLTKKYSDLVGMSSTSGPLLRLAYADEEVVDWSLFPNLDVPCLRAAFKGDELKKITSLSISGTMAMRSPRLVEALSLLSNLDTLYAFDTPGRTEDAASTRVFHELSKSSPNLIKKNLALSGPFSHSIRRDPWFFGRESELLPAFPVVQMLAYHDLDTAEIPGNFSQLESFFLGDAFLTPVRAVTGLFRYFESLNDAVFSRFNGTSIRVANCFAAASSSLGISDDVEIGPLPAELYTFGKASYHSSRAHGCYSVLRDLLPGQWTIFVWASPSKYAEDEVPSPNVSFKYAFVRSKVLIPADDTNEFEAKVEDLEAVDAKEFLRRTAPGVETDVLQDHTDSVTRQIYGVQVNEDDVVRLRPRILKCMEVEEVHRLLEKFMDELPKLKVVHDRLGYRNVR